MTDWETPIDRLPTIGDPRPHWSEDIVKVHRDAALDALLWVFIGLIATVVGWLAI